MTAIEPDPGTTKVPANPVLETLGVRVLRVAPGLAQFDLRIEADHLNIQGALHGGITATLLDVAGGYAGLLDETGEASSGAVTVSLTIHYVSGISTGSVFAEGRIIGGGRTLYFAEGRVTAADGTLVATAQGTYRRVGKRA